MTRKSIVATGVTALAATATMVGCVATEEDLAGTLQEVGMLGDYCYAYRDINFSGDLYVFTWQRDRNDLHRVPNFGDSMSSIECFGGGGLRLYRDSNWGGSVVTVNSGEAIANLATHGLNDAVSSARWVDSSAYAGTCTVYNNSNYGGASLIIPFHYDYNDLHRVTPTSFGDSISSISCTANLAPILCKDADWEGACMTLITGSDPDLTDNGFGDNISSIRFHTPGL